MWANVVEEDSTICVDREDNAIDLSAYIPWKTNEVENEENLVNVEEEVKV